jgi:hypothetical protein
VDEVSSVRGVGVAIGGAGAISAVVAIGWQGLLLTVVLAAFAMGGACWVLNDQERTQRLTLIIRAWTDQHDHRGRSGSRTKPARDRRS